MAKRDQNLKHEILLEYQRDTGLGLDFIIDTVKKVPIPEEVIDYINWLEDKVASHMARLERARLMVVDINKKLHGEDN